MVGHLPEPLITLAEGFSLFVPSGRPPLFSGSHEIGRPRDAATGDVSVGGLCERPRRS